MQAGSSDGQMKPLMAANQLPARRHVEFQNPTRCALHACLNLARLRIIG